MFRVLVSLEFVAVCISFFLCFLCLLLSASLVGHECFTIVLSVVCWSKICDVGLNCYRDGSFSQFPYPVDKMLHIYILRNVILAGFINFFTFSYCFSTKRDMYLFEIINNSETIFSISLILQEQFESIFLETQVFLNDMLSRELHIYLWRITVHSWRSTALQISSQFSLPV